jgi:cytochrome c oxidase subunit II
MASRSRETRTIRNTIDVMTEILKKFGMVDAAASHAKGVDDLLGYVHLLMLALFIGWLAYYLLALVKFRRAANPKADYVGVKGHMSTYLEIGVAVVEAVLLVGFAIPLWARAVDHFPKAEENPVEVRIMGQQFKWNAHYYGADKKWGKQDVKFASATNPFGLDSNDEAAKDDVTCLLGEPFKLPLGRPAICLISSMDVIHSFKIPAMRITQDAIPGLSIPAHFTPTKLGKYSITCAQLCGSGHSAMRGDFEVVSPEEWDAWYAEKSKAGGASSFE